jgi:hypothetical protein
MAARGRLWGSERIRGELLKLGIKVSQRIGQRVPANPTMAIDASKPVKVTSVIGGLHVDYCRAA